MANKVQFFILTGEPGVGKTFLTKKLCAAISGKGIGVKGFYTEEIKQSGIRAGFDVISLNGKRGRLARQQNLLSGPIKFKVGKYGVLVNEFENVALPSLEMSVPKDDKNVLIIDEIGKMEFFSRPFKSAMQTIFAENSPAIALATIPAVSNDKFIESLKTDKRAKVWTITYENRNYIYEDIMREINAVLKDKA